MPATGPRASPLSELNPAGWPLDKEQWQSYATQRSIIYDTRAGSFLPPNPSKYIGTALKRGGQDVPRIIFASEEHTHPMHHLWQFELIKAVNEYGFGHRTHRRSIALLANVPGTVTSLTHTPTFDRCTRRLDDAPLTIGLEMFTSTASTSQPSMPLSSVEPGGQKTTIQDLTLTRHTAYLCVSLALTNTLH